MRGWITNLFRKSKIKVQFILLCNRYTCQATYPGKSIWSFLVQLEHKTHIYLIIMRMINKATSVEPPKKVFKILELSEHPKYCGTRSLLPGGWAPGQPRRRGTLEEKGLKMAHISLPASEGQLLLRCRQKLKKEGTAMSNDPEERTRLPPLENGLRGSENPLHKRHGRTLAKTV